MARITITCDRCKASCTDDLEHVLDWDKRHDVACPKKATS